MPLRDHFHPPVDDRHSWDELHGMWPGEIVRQLFGRLPAGYVAAPGVHLGRAFEVDVATFEEGDPPPGGVAGTGGGAAVATWTAPSPTLTVETDLPEADEYEVRVYDARRGRRLVAAIELVSPSNKDRPEHRRAFVGKCAELLRQNVCVSIVDVVTARQFSLYADLLDYLGRSDPSLGDAPPHLYAVTVRGRTSPRRKSVLDTYVYPVAVGQPLPSLPIWLTDTLGVTLDLEPCYEETCRFLHIR